MNRRIFLSAVAPACLSPLYFRFVEPNWFEVSHTDVRIPGVRPKRILQILTFIFRTALHFADLEPGFRAGLAARPDLICLTGDFVSRTSGFDRTGLQRFLRMAADTAPSYAVLGNHDGGHWIQRCCGGDSTDMMRDLVASSGVRMLHNESAGRGGPNAGRRR